LKRRIDKRREKNTLGKTRFKQKKKKLELETFGTGRDVGEEGKERPLGKDGGDESLELETFGKEEEEGKEKTISERWKFLKKKKKNILKI
jgi:hypothetical protein